MHQKSGRDVRTIHACANDLHVTRTAFLRYRVAMAGVVRAMGVEGASVEDVVHDAFELACRKPEIDRPDPRDEARFGGWLCALARYAAMTTRNDSARSREISASAEELEGVPEQELAYIGHYDDKVAASVVFAGLSEEDRTLLQQHFYEDKTVKELAEEQGVPWTTMRSRLDGAIARARTILTEGRSSHRRGAGAAALLWLIFGVRERAREGWSNWISSSGARVACSSAFGAVATAMVIAALFHQSHAMRVPAEITSDASRQALVAAPTLIPRHQPAFRLSTASASVSAPASPVSTSTPVQYAQNSVRREYQERSISLLSVANALRDAPRAAKQTKK